MFLKRPTPYEDEVAAIHSPAAAAARRKRCEEIRKGLSEDALNRIFRAVPMTDENAVVSPIYTGGILSPTESQKREGRAEFRRRFEALVLRELETNELAREMASAFNSPERISYARIIRPWEVQVERVIFEHGNKAEAFAGRVRDLLRDRDLAGADGDEDDVRSIERRLDKLTGVPFPVMPQAAFAAAEMLPAGDREAELERLEAKYGNRTGAETPSSNGSGKVRAARKTRVLSALTN
jgi:hypothetical protein